MFQPRFVKLYFIIHIMKTKIVLNKIYNIKYVFLVTYAILDILYFTDAVENLWCVKVVRLKSLNLIEKYCKFLEKEVGFFLLVMYILGYFGRRK